MNLQELLSGVTVEQSVPVLNVNDIAVDSREVKQGSLFFALKGTRNNGLDFVGEAVAKGAVAIVADHELPLQPCPVIYVKDARLSLARVAARFYKNQPETIAAVTGTSGKTSVASFLQQIWAHSGIAAASIGTIGVYAPSGLKYGSLTTPDPIKLHKILKDLFIEGVTHVAMEASSHGIDQHRLDGVNLSAAAFTNLGRDHLDYHKTIENYFAAKMHLFDELLPRDRPAIIFSDDNYSQAAIDHVQKAGRTVLTVGKKGSFIQLKSVKKERSRQILLLEIQGTQYDISLPLAGDFQVANALVSAGLAIVTGVDKTNAMQSLEQLAGPPGRLQLIGYKNSDAVIYVDYAHKPEALSNVLNSVRPFTKNRVIVVFGCGGDRDKGKRPLMGAIANQLADIVIVTDDNPRFEDAAQIRREILAAVPKALEFGDRRQAIHQAISLLQSGDTLIVAGKGHETGQIIGDKIHHFSDQEEILRALGEPV